MQYSFEHYFTDEELKKSYESAKSVIMEECQKLYGLPVENLSEDIFQEHWRQKCNYRWLNGGDWQLLWVRSGREQIVFTHITKDAFLDRCRIHLSGCLMSTFDNCDFKEKWYGTDPDLVEYSAFCIKCLERPTKGSASKTHCARCYREILNKWRPV